MRKPSRFGPWGLAGLAALGGFLVFHVWVPAPGKESSVCLLRRLSGLPCPGCGMTRAFAHLAKGEWAAAAASHLLVYAVAAELAAAWLLWGAALARGREVRMPPGFERVVLGHLVVLAAFWLGRVATGTLPW